VSNLYELEAEAARRTARVAAAAAEAGLVRAARAHPGSGRPRPGRLAGLIARTRAALPSGAPAACCPAAA
jgi:hypothetical protein